MKAHRQTDPKPFEPVILTLESQEEVDGVFALLNNLATSSAVNLGDLPVDQLRPFVSNHRIHQSSISAICK